MKALSWKEPFATLMMHGKIETRPWPTKYRGLVLICASKMSYSKAEAFNIAGLYQYSRIEHRLKLWPDDPAPELYHPGHAIAVGELVDCRPMERADENACFVQFGEGKWCHIYENVRAIKPMPWKGGQKWRNVPNDFVQQIEYV